MGKKSGSVGKVVLVAVVVIIIIAGMFYATKSGYINFSTVDNQGNIEYVKLSGTVKDHFTKAPLQGANVYIMYQDTLISAVTDADGSFTTTDKIPEGSQVTVMIEKTGYLIAYFTEVEVPTGDYSFKEDAYIGTFEIILKSAVSIKLSDQQGNLISSSYNMTESGTALQLTIDIILGTDEAGWGQSYTDITSYDPSDPKNIYVGGILLIQIDTQYVAVDNRGAFNRVPGLGTTDYFYLNVGTLLRNDDAGQYGKYSYSIGLTCLGAGSNAITVKLFNSVSQDDLENGYFGGLTADASVAIDIVA